MVISFTENAEAVTVQARRSYDPLTHGYDGAASGIRGEHR